MATKKAAAPAAKKTAPAKPKAAAKKVVVTTTLKQIAGVMAESHSMSKRAAEDFMADLVEQISKRLTKGEKIRMSGIGTLDVRKRAARIGRNPATGEELKIPASKKVGFRVAKELKEAL